MSKQLKPTKEAFAIGFHRWCMKIGFIGFHIATWEEKITKYKEYLVLNPDKVKELHSEELLTQRDP